MGSVPKTTHKDFDVEDVLDKLNIDEKVALLSGTDFWHTASVPRLGVPAVRVSDGPNGVRGTKFFNGVPAACLPCGEQLLNMKGTNTDGCRNRLGGNMGHRPHSEGWPPPGQGSNRQRSIGNPRANCEHAEITTGWTRLRVFQ